MAYSYVTYTGDGSTQIYTVPFPFIKQEDIHVFLDAEEVPAERIEWLSESSIKFDMPPEQGAVIRIRRDTDKEEAVVDFHDGSVLSEEDLDQNTRQLLFVAQEAYDALEGSPTIDNDNKWDMRGLPIKNVGPAEDPDDAVNYRQYSTDMLPTLQDLQQKTAQSEANAKASEVAAAQSRQAAATSQTAAKGSEVNAKASEVAAAESARQAEDWTERAKAWAESPTPPDPDDPESKSAKEWAKAASDTVPIATPSIAGKVMPQTGDADGLELETDGKLRVRHASATQRGSVQASTTAKAFTVPTAQEDGTLDSSWFHPVITMIEEAAPGIASKDSLGVIKVGEGLAIRLDGTLDAVQNEVELVFTSSVAAWEAPETAVYRITCVGGGGKGGTGGKQPKGTMQGAAGGGGGGAATLNQTKVVLTKGDTVAITVGGPGGTSSFGNYAVSAGGASGGNASANTPGHAGSNTAKAGTASSYRNLGGGAGGAGAPGYSNAISATTGGTGGGNSGLNRAPAPGGRGGTGYGAGGGGGGGASANYGDTMYNPGSGGNGAPGVVIINYVSTEG